MKQEHKDFFKRFQLGFVLLIFILIVSFLSDSFLTSGNIINVLRQTSVNAIIAAGMTFVILTGGIDLSVGSIFAFSGAVAAFLLADGQPALVAVGAALLIGLAIGIGNGFFIVRWNLQPFIVTLATMTIFRGATLVFTDGRPISTGREAEALLFGKIGSGSILGMPTPILLMILVFALSYFILKHMRIGRYIYATGGNQEATRLSGVSIAKVKLFAYGICGLFAALAGVIITARLSSAQPTAGAGYELDAIAAVVLGGTSLAGGVGSIFGTVMGAMIIGILNNALNLLDVTSYYQQLAKGLVILLAILLDRKEKV